MAARGARVLALCCAFTLATAVSVDSSQGTEKLWSQGYTNWVVNQWAQQNQGNVGAIAMTSEGDVGVGKAYGAALNIDANTVFEVGSTTKTFATLAAEILAGQGKLDFEGPISAYLPSSVKMIPDVASITLKQLVSHTSGLERMPSNIQPKDPNDPMADYTADDLYAYLSGLQSIGAKKFLYSNTGFGLLGWITCLVSGKGWEELVKELILDPLAMTDTSVTLSASQKSRLAPPYSNGKPSNLITFTDAFVGAGGMRSTATDMLQYTKAYAALVSVPSEIRKAMDRMDVPIAPDEFAALDGKVDEAFQEYYFRQQTVVWKDGATNGFNCFMSYMPGKRASIILSNTAAVSQSSAVALPAHLIMAGAPTQHQRIQVPVSSLSSFSGAFALPRDATQPGDVYQVQPTYQDSLYVSSQRTQPIEIVPFGLSEFFNSQSGLEAVFDTAKHTLRLTFSGQDHFAEKTSGSFPTEKLYLNVNATLTAELAYFKSRSMRM
ncbi:hypothetical protein CYMTET_49449 [Cymbomonas tetramitiformis]|uniref:Beta-lactamase-related domain-containing protein n=1 Tax=Cymbomonas tetramitiformis TaxID=36881 RepID=A0AAE0EUI9_9CHLO|nr:hypothetical protein CYMTET_49449 [Cymbomonas tetramitiformis]